MLDVPGQHKGDPAKTTRGIQVFFGFPALRQLFLGDSCQVVIATLIAAGAEGFKSSFERLVSASILIWRAQVLQGVRNPGSANILDNLTLRMQGVKWG